MLTVKGIDIFRGEAQILWDIEIQVVQGEVVTLLGANGAGKTTLMESILGLHHPSKGTIQFLSQDIATLPPHKITRLGISCVPEGRRLFKDMTVYENLELGAYPKESRPLLGKSVEWVYSMFPVLRDRRDQISGTLSGGEQQMLAIGRALMARPKLILIDELSLGLSPKITQEIYATISRLRQEGVTILIIEQNATLALHHSDRGYVLETGKIVLHGSAAELLQNELICKAYLGM
jgi:branched-chain amino acid transport system ATP-binding protein